MTKTASAGLSRKRTAAQISGFSAAAIGLARKPEIFTKVPCILLSRTLPKLTVGKGWHGNLVGHPATGWRHQNGIVSLLPERKLTGHWHRYRWGSSQNAGTAAVSGIVLRAKQRGLTRKLTCRPS